VLEHLEVLGDGLGADRERPRQLVDGGVALGQTVEDRPPRRVGERGEGGAERVAGYFFRLGDEFWSISQLNN
jgi:hypothetical protein